MRFLTIIILTSLFLLACVEQDSISPNTFSSREILRLKEMGVNPSDCKIVEDYIEIKGEDFVIPLARIQNSVVTSRQFVQEEPDIPAIGLTDDINVFIHPSLLTSPNWLAAVQEAVTCINGVEDCRVNLNLTYDKFGTSDITVVLDNTTDPSIPSTYKDLDSDKVAVAEIATNGELGAYISANDDFEYDDFLDKAMVHEFYHTLGFHHTCGNIPDNAIHGRAHVETTWSSMGVDDCDTTSVLDRALTGIMGGLLSNNSSTMYGPPHGGTGSPTQSTGSGTDSIGGNVPGNGGCLWLNPDDVFSLQALYPESYSPFTFEIVDCSSAPPDAIHDGSSLSGPYAANFVIEYIEYDFVPYKIIFEVVDTHTGDVYGSAITYRYWPDGIIIGYDSPDPTNDCLSLKITVENFKGDFMQSAVSRNCCVVGD